MVKIKDWLKKKKEEKKAKIEASEKRKALNREYIVAQRKREEARRMRVELINHFVKSKMVVLLKDILKDMVPDKLSQLKLFTSKTLGEKTVKFYTYNRKYKVLYKYNKSVFVSSEPLLISELLVGCLYTLSGIKPYRWDKDLTIRLEYTIKTAIGDNIVSPEIIEYEMYFYADHGEDTFVDKLKEQLKDNFFPLLETIFGKEKNG